MSRLRVELPVHTVYCHLDFLAVFCIFSSEKAWTSKYCSKYQILYHMIPRRHNTVPYYGGGKRIPLTTKIPRNIYTVPGYRYAE